MKRLLLSICLITTTGNIVIAKEIKPFTTDGCSVFPDGTIEQNSLWMQCCIRHDFAYWKGGTEEQRKKADSDLEHCVADLGKKNISLIMLMGVRVGGSPFFPTGYRWGYGWPYLRGYQTLSDEEKIQIKSRINDLQNLLNEFSEQVK